MSHYANPPGVAPPSGAVPQILLSRVVSGYYHSVPSFMAPSLTVCAPQQEIAPKLRKEEKEEEE